MYNDLRMLQEEIADLDQRARESETWLLDNTMSADWFERKDRYDDILFRLAQKKQKVATIMTGNIYVPETMTLPARPNSSRDF